MALTKKGAGFSPRRTNKTHRYRNPSSGQGPPPLPADFVPTPAATPRSPNRKPRVKRAAQTYAVEGLKRRFLDCLLATGSVPQSAALIQRGLTDVYHWREKDKAFATGWEATKLVLKLIHEGRLESLTGKAIDAVEGFVEGKTKDKRLLWDVVKALLISKGLLKTGADAKLELVGEGGGPIEFTLNLGKQSTPGVQALSSRELSGGIDANTNP